MAAAGGWWGGGCVGGGVFRGGYLREVPLRPRLRPGGRVVRGAAAGGTGGDHGGLYRRTLLRGEPLLAQTGNDARLAGSARALGTAGMAARLGAFRFSLAVAGLCVHRFAPPRMGARSRRLRSHLG